MDLGSDGQHSDKKDGKNESKSKKKNDHKADNDASLTNEEVKQPTYQWTSITADGLVYR